MAAKQNQNWDKTHVEKIDTIIYFYILCKNIIPSQQQTFFENGVESITKCTAKLFNLRTTEVWTTIYMMYKICRKWGGCKHIFFIEMRDYGIGQLYLRNVPMIFN